MVIKPKYSLDLRQKTIDELETVLNWVRERLKSHREHPEKHYLTIKDMRKISNILVDVAKAINTLVSSEEKIAELRKEFEELKKIVQQQQKNAT